MDLHHLTLQSTRSLALKDSITMWTFYISLRMYTRTSRAKIGTLKSRILWVTSTLALNELSVALVEVSPHQEVSHQWVTLQKPAQSLDILLQFLPSCLPHFNSLPHLPSHHVLLDKCLPVNKVGCQHLPAQVVVHNPNHNVKIAEDNLHHHHPLPQNLPSNLSPSMPIGGNPNAKKNLQVLCLVPKLLASRLKWFNAKSNRYLTNSHSKNSR